MKLLSSLVFLLVANAASAQTAAAPAAKDTACHCPAPTVGPLDRIRPMAPNVANGNVSGVDRKNLQFAWSWTDEGTSCVDQTIVYDTRDCAPSAATPTPPAGAKGASNGPAWPSRVNTRKCSKYDFPIRSLTWELVVVEAGAKMPKGKELQDLVDGKLITGATEAAKVVYRATGRPRTLCNPNGDPTQPLLEWGKSDPALATLPWTNGTWYAWQVTVRINNTTVEKSRVWGFRVAR